jgi:hypothetical protein
MNDMYFSFHMFLSLQYLIFFRITPIDESRIRRVSLSRVIWGKTFPLASIFIIKMTRVTQFYFG